MAAVVFYLSYLLILLLALVFWIVNLVSVVKLFLVSAPFTTLFIGKIIGVPVFPLGALLGLFS